MLSMPRRLQGPRRPRPRAPVQDAVHAVHRRDVRGGDHPGADATLVTSGTNSNLLSPCSHENAWASLHLLGEPNILPSCQPNILISLVRRTLSWPPEAEPLPAFYRCAPTGMRRPACTFSIVSLCSRAFLQECVGQLAYRFGQQNTLTSSPGSPYAPPSRPMALFSPP